MARIVFAGQSYQCAEGQSVLECLTANGVAIPSACGAGVCQTCLMRAVSGVVDAVAQRGLKSGAAGQGYFLACQFRPSVDIEVALEDSSGRAMPARVLSIEPLNADIVRVRLRPEEPFAYRAGQFLRLFRDASTSRCYSLASVPGLDAHVELHVGRVPNGLVSGWVHEELKAGDRIRISESTGSSFYVNANPEQGLCLIGTGSGLAPLYAIGRDALHQGHHGPVWLFHGSRRPSGLYLQDELRGLAMRCANFHYVPCVADAPGEPSLGLMSGRVHDIAMARLPDLQGWSVHLSGNPEMVQQGQRDAYLTGAALRDIHSDPFLPTGSR